MALSFSPNPGGAAGQNCSYKSNVAKMEPCAKSSVNKNHAKMRSLMWIHVNEIMELIKSGDVKTVIKRMLDDGVDITGSFDETYYSSYLSSLSVEVQLVEYLLDIRVDPRIIPRRGITPVWWCMLSKQNCNCIDTATKIRILQKLRTFTCENCPREVRRVARRMSRSGVIRMRALFEEGSEVHH